MYNLESHSKAKGYYYNQDSEKVPVYYNVTGPGQYFETDSMLDMKNESLSKHGKQTNVLIGKEDFPKGFYENLLPLHRFTGYSRKQLNSELLESKNLNTAMNNGFVPNKTMVESCKKLNMLKPSFI